MFLNLDQVAAIERCFITVRVAPVELMTMESVKAFHIENQHKLNKVIFDRTGVHILHGVIDTYYEDELLLNQLEHKLTYQWRALSDKIEITYPPNTSTRLIQTKQFVNPHTPYSIVLYDATNVISLNESDSVLNIPKLDLDCQGWRVETGAWVYGR